jgi:hypothetical protein
MKPALIFFFCVFISVRALAQETSLAGIIFDTESKERISRVNIANLTSGYFTYDNINGTFEIDAKVGDKLIFSQAQHHADTIIVKDFTPIAVYLKATSIQLKPVNIRDSKLDPDARLAAKKKDYGKAYGSLADDDYLTLTPGLGVGLGIDAIWNALSREGRNAAHLRETIANDYKQDVIDSRYNRAFVARITGLSGSRLTDFMRKYRPGYYFLSTASEYEFITSIRNNLRRYFRNPAAHALMPLDSLKKPLDTLKK